MKKYATPIRIYRQVFIFLFSGLFAVPLVAQPDSVVTSQPITAIVGAFDAEVRLLQSNVTDRQDEVILGIQFVTGQLKGRRVVIAQTGVGKVNAAMTTALIIQHFQPDEVIFSGIAGGVNPKLRPGDMVIAEKTAQHDYGAVVDQAFASRQTRHPVTQAENPLYFAADSALLALAMQVAGQVPLETAQSGSARQPAVIKGTVVTGDVFVASEKKRRQLRKDFGADATEMEGAAVAQICWQRQVPCLVIRSLSDTAGSNARQSMQNFYAVAARNSANLVMAIVAELR